MSLYGWLGFGLVIGMVANYIDPRRSIMGVATGVMVAVVGAMIGGMTASMFFSGEDTGIKVLSTLLAFLGAIFLLGTSKILRTKI